MKKLTKIVVALLLMTAVVWAVGFTKNNESPNMNESDDSYNGHEYVDLGLPSGTLWATCNVGATTPEGYGNYYAWGETETKDIYDWSTYKWCNGNYKQLTKYCRKSHYGDNGFTDELTHLQLSDDAARANWGGDWRMPTKAEWQELLNFTTHMEMTRNGVKGRLFIGSNGATLFLPAAGYREDGSLKADGRFGCYCSSFFGGLERAWYLFCVSGMCRMQAIMCTRDAGLSVRPVCSSRLKYESNGSYKGHDYVDMGLPGGTLWATCNIGANTPEGYGNYYAWGETETKDTYTWENYIYAEGTSLKDPRWTKYCRQSDKGNNGFTDNLTTLQFSDDAARANWGGDWRMPTEDEWDALLEYTTSTWTTQNGVYGWLFTASNGATLFLPAAGRYYEDEDLDKHGVGSDCRYWSSSLERVNYAGAVNFGGRYDYDQNKYICYTSNAFRFCGFSVRPVRTRVRTN